METHTELDYSHLYTIDRLIKKKWRCDMKRIYMRANTFTKRIIAIDIILAMIICSVIMFAGCANNNNSTSLIGTWYSTDEPDDISITLKKNGDVDYSGWENVGTWSSTEKTITVDFDDGRNFEMRVNNETENTLLVDVNDNTTWIKDYDKAIEICDSVEMEFEDLDGNTYKIGELAVFCNDDTICNDITQIYSAYYDNPYSAKEKYDYVFAQGVDRISSIEESYGGLLVYTESGFAISVDKLMIEREYHEYEETESCHGNVYKEMCVGDTIFFRGKLDVDSIDDDYYNNCLLVKPNVVETDYPLDDCEALSGKHSEDVIWYLWK